eukprot:c12052_g2_i1.p1 GENE.c12052_g2_i1~~c12052_g2_i1.p1  ORF type:complete len:459 (-),score=76.99 c12052_g2_i1:1485-2711(-)
MEDRYGSNSGPGFGLPALDDRKPVLKWDQHDVLEWLDRVNLSVLKPQFQAHEITGDMLVELTNEDFEVEMEVTSSFLRKRIVKEIEALRHSSVGNNNTNSHPQIPKEPESDDGPPGPGESGFSLSDTPRSSHPPRKRSSISTPSRTSSPHCRSAIPPTSLADSSPQNDQQMVGPVLLSQAFVELFNNNMQYVETLLRDLMGISDQYRAQVKLLLHNLRRIDPPCFMRLASFLFPNLSLSQTQGGSTVDMSSLPGDMLIESMLRKLDPSPSDHRAHLLDLRPISTLGGDNGVADGLPMSSCAPSSFPSHSNSASSAFHHSSMPLGSLPQPLQSQSILMQGPQLMSSSSLSSMPSMSWLSNRQNKSQTRQNPFTPSLFDTLTPNQRPGSWWRFFSLPHPFEIKHNEHHLF